MRPGSRTRYIFAAIAVAVFLLLLLFVAELSRRSSPLRVGATADEVWDFAHTRQAWNPKSVLTERERRNWVAHAHDIQFDENILWKYYWSSNRLILAKRHIYLLGTNGTVTGVKSFVLWSIFSRTPASTSFPARYIGYTPPGVRALQSSEVILDHPFTSRLTAQTNSASRLPANLDLLNHPILFRLYLPVGQ